MISSFTGRYSFLSNFHIVGIHYKGTQFPSVEHAFQAAKTDDLRWVEKIACATSPQQAKVLGNKCPLRKDWDNVKLDVMSDLLWIKFNCEPYRNMLLGTGGEELVEGNTHGDTYWGVCKGKGENNLGILLMIVRTHLVQFGPDASDFGGRW